MSQDKQRKPRNTRINSPSPPHSQKKSPIWKAAIIQVLRGTIGVLENTVVKLETESPPTSTKKPNLLERVFLGWDRFLQNFRLFLPSKVSNNVSDTVLTVIIAVFTVVIVGTTTFIFTSKPAQVATLPPVEEVPVPTSTPEPKLAPKPEPEPETKIEPIPTSIPEPEPETEIETKIEPIPTSTPEPETEPEIETKIEPIPTSTPEPETEPEPQPEAIIELTPEQSLIAAIENNLKEVAVITIKNKDQKQEDDKITINLIKSIQVNFRSSDLTITINDDWYNLETSQQQQLVADILQSSQELDFTHLQLIDSENRLIARSPVVGNEMIIFSQHSGVSSQQ
jgi:hypothetical protein